jgi:uncharacterized membrane protein YeaQ/YmgE (transglycosylase-associated protein family)
MGILAWVLLGVVIAWLERQLLPHEPRSSFVVSMGLGILGAILGNGIMYALGYAEISGFNLRTVLISVVGASIILLAYRLIRMFGRKPAVTPTGDPRP